METYTPPIEHGNPRPPLAPNREMPSIVRGEQDRRTKKAACENASGLLSGGSRTPVELFAAGVETLNAAITAQITAISPLKSH